MTNKKLAQEQRTKKEGKVIEVNFLLQSLARSHTQVALILGYIFHISLSELSCISLIKWLMNQLMPFLAILFSLDNF